MQTTMSTSMSIRTLFLSCILVASAPNALCDAVDLSQPTMPSAPGDSEHNVPVGIEGNGIYTTLGIEGNGIVQRLFADSLVINDTPALLQYAGVRVTVDRAPALASAVQPGQVAKMRAVEPFGGVGPVVSSLRIDHLIRGPIDPGGIDLENGVITVLGQAVPVAPFAVLADGADDLDPASLAAGDYLLISGAVAPDGSILATRFERQAATGDFEIGGWISGVEAAGFEMSVAGQVVDYSAATFAHMTSADLAAGRSVEVVASGVDGAGRLLAKRIAPLGPASVHSSRTLVEVQGFVDSVEGQAFWIGDLRVTPEPGVDFINGQSGDLQPGRFVEVEGMHEGSVGLTARRIEFEEPVILSEVRLFAPLEEVQTSSSSVRLFGVDVGITPATSLRGLTGSDDLVELSAYNVGQTVEVRGYEDPQSGVVATRMRLEMPDSPYLRGTVRYDGQALTVLGLQVWLFPGTQFEAADGTPIDEAAFLELAQRGVLATIEGDPAPGGIDADLIEVQEESSLLPPSATRSAPAAASARTGDQATPRTRRAGEPRARGAGRR